MTEPRLAEFFTVVAAVRLELISIAGRLAQRSAAMSESLDEDAAEGVCERVEGWSIDMGEDALALAHLVEQLTSRADAAMDETQPMDLADVADEW